MSRIPSRRLAAAVSAICLGLLVAAAAQAQTSDAGRLAKELRPFLACLNGQREAFVVSGQAELPIDGRTQKVTMRLERFDADSFDLSLKHEDYWVEVRRRQDATALALPLHKVVFLGRGETDATDHLAPVGISQRLISGDTLVASYAPLVQGSDPAALSAILTGLLKVAYDPAAEQWTVGKNLSFKFSPAATAVDVRADATRLRIELPPDSGSNLEVDAWDDLATVELDRRELERQLARGARRALEILAPGPTLTTPAEAARTVEHGELRWIEGHRVALLRGTPEQIGHAHGQLLSQEAQRCIDSVLYSFGTAQTIRTGRWFRHDLDAAYARLAPHIPEDHKRETRAMAESLGLDTQLAESLNVFPELFHCSGFAVFGEATKDGKLYHGRVLDYMTAIGLQDAATTFIVAVDGKIPFANVGYAGFIGSVTGMNAKAISLGEMGGRGEGLWDGAPMATLMRRGLEECSTLDEVMDLWKNSPRTCEYYYVFADGKTNRAVGVAAVPQSVEFILPGQSDPRLGDGIKDAVVLSAGSRLETLRGRVQQRHGELDAKLGQWLMSRPVAMSSNLHNVLFVPADGVLYVANADHQRPAAECHYVRLDLHALLESVSISSKPEAAKAGGGTP